MELAALETREWVAIIAGAVVIAALIYWRLRQGRLDKEAEDADRLKP
jgi:hypothetical protein